VQKGGCANKEMGTLNCERLRRPKRKKIDGSDVIPQYLGLALCKIDDEEAGSGQLTAL